MAIKDNHESTIIQFWGTGDSMGVPRVYCSCEVCEEARAGGINRRLRSSIHLQRGKEELLVDCGPDWRQQMEFLGKRALSQVLITHAHFDHIGGLPELADLCRWNGETVKVYAPGEVLEQINSQFPWVRKQLLFVELQEETVLLGWKVEAFKVYHGKNGFAYAYRFDSTTGSNASWVYCPDSIGLQELEKAKMRGLSLLILGTSYYHEQAEYATRSVYDMKEALELLQELRPEKCCFTHMSHGVDLRVGYPLPQNVILSRTWDKYVLS